MHSYRKKCVFPHIRNFTLICGPYSCLIYVLFGPIFNEKIVFVFSNARSILELMLCNSNLTKLGILTLLSFDCRAWAFQSNKHLKKWMNRVFVFVLPIPTQKYFFPHFLFILFNFFISYIFTKFMWWILLFIY